MAIKLVNKGFNGWSQLGIFLGMIGIGLVAGSVASIGVWSWMTGQNLGNMQEDMMNPKYADAIKIIQLVTTVFIFFIPAVAYAFICFRNGWLALGFQKNLILKIAGLSLVIIAASMPFIDWLAGLNKVIHIPLSSKNYFDELEKTYEDQVKVIGDVKTLSQYFLSLIIIALLPAVFEELFFRGALQNLLSRWKFAGSVYVFVAAFMVMAIRAIWLQNLNPWIFNGVVIVMVLFLLRSHTIYEAINRATSHFIFPVVITAILFSAVHASWYGFIPRVALGMILGLIFHFTNNILYSILVHFFNNAAVVTVMFLAARQNKPVSDAEEQGFPWWAGIISLLVLIVLFRLLTRQPNLEKPPELIEERGNPFQNNFFENKE